MAIDTKEGLYEMIHKILTGIMIPVVFYILAQINGVKEELTQHEVKAAQNESKYALRDDIVRVEQKIDDLRSLIIQEIRAK